MVATYPRGDRIGIPTTRGTEMSPSLPSDLPTNRAPGAADEGTVGAEQEPGVGQDPAEVDADGEGAKRADDAPSVIDIEDIKPAIDDEDDDDGEDGEGGGGATW